MITSITFVVSMLAVSFYMIALPKLQGF